MRVERIEWSLEAINEVVKKYYPKIKELQVFNGFDTQTADEITQEAIINVLTHSVPKTIIAGSAEEANYLKILIYKKQRQTRVDQWRGASREIGEEVEIDAQFGDPGQINPEEAVERKMENAIIQAALDQLPEHMKLVLELHYVDELHLKEIAKICKTTVPAIKGIQNRALNKLRKLLEEK